MKTAKEANKYIIRHRLWDNGPGSGCRVNQTYVWAFSAEDAVVQVETHNKGNSNFGPITYVGPYVQGCACLNECLCGVEAFQ